MEPDKFLLAQSLLLRRQTRSEGLQNRIREEREWSENKYQRQRGYGSSVVSSESVEPRKSFWVKEVDEDTGKAKYVKRVQPSLKVPSASPSEPEWVKKMDPVSGKFRFVRPMEGAHKCESVPPTFVIDLDAAAVRGVRNTDWSTINAMMKSEDGSAGVYFVRCHDGVVVTKPLGFDQFVNLFVATELGRMYVFHPPLLSRQLFFLLFPFCQFAVYNSTPSCFAQGHTQLTGHTRAVSTCHSGTTVQAFPLACAECPVYYLR
jgi:hypothetical protein